MVIGFICTLFGIFRAVHRFLYHPSSRTIVRTQCSLRVQTKHSYNLCVHTTSLFNQTNISVKKVVVVLVVQLVVEILILQLYYYYKTQLALLLPPIQLIAVDEIFLFCYAIQSCFRSTSMTASSRFDHKHDLTIRSLERQLYADCFRFTVLA